MNITINSDPVDEQPDQHITTREFTPRHVYYAHHIPTGEDWYILGIDPKGDKVCAAGWPATIGKLSDCKDFKLGEPLTSEELAHRERKFGKNWI